LETIEENIRLDPADPVAGPGEVVVDIFAASNLLRIGTLLPGFADGEDLIADTKVIDGRADCANQAGKITPQDMETSLARSRRRAISNRRH
jgi:hypothetical protein